MEDSLKELEVMGVRVKLDVDALDDVDILDLLAELNDGNALVLNRLLKALFRDRYQEVREALSEDGRFKASTAADFLVQVLEAANAKN